MGIININRESFFAESRVEDAADVIAQINKMLEAGADIIDIGACSTRPGSTPVTMEQEWSYLEAPLKELARVIKERDCTILSKSSLDKISNTRYALSVDTFHAEIVKRVYETIGEFTVNDISAGEGADDTNSNVNVEDKNESIEYNNLCKKSQMLKYVGEKNLPYIAMHKRGTPSTMQQMCNYPNGVVNEVIEYFKSFEKKAAEYGIKEYVVDPGLGFAKTLEQNYQLLNGISKIKEALKEQCGTERKILIGLSRKGMIWRLLNITPGESLPGTVALNLQALQLGADIIRVHDVTEGTHTVKMWEALQ